MAKITIEQAAKLAVLHHQAGQIAQAEQLYRQILSCAPDHSEALHNLGLIAFGSGRHDVAADLMRRAVAARPDWPEANSNLGNVLNALGRRDEAIAAQRRAIALRPGFAEAHFNLGNILRDRERMDEAIAAFIQAVALRPDWAEARVNLGNSLRDAGRYIDAVAAFRQAIAIRPELAEAHYNLALALLTLGEFSQGWEEYEWRWRRRNAGPALRNFPQPRWDGQPVVDGTLLLHAEQGFGDTMQFIRYLPLAAQRCGRIIIECQPELKSLIEPMAAGCAVVARGQALPAFDVHCPMLSLPDVFGTTIETIPRKIPYLHADASLSAKWRERLGGGPKMLKVGLAWAGRKTHVQDHSRSMSLSSFAPLGKLPNISFNSLQKGVPPAGANDAPPGFSLIDMTEDLHDFADTAALIANLDLVISVDTAVAHLAGAMGKPVWVLLAFAPDWRWLLDRNDSPWYPTMRLFRQRAIGDWDGVMRQVAEALAEFLRLRLSPQLNPDGHHG